MTDQSSAQPAQLPDTFQDLVSPEKKAFAALGLVLKDGTPR